MLETLKEKWNDILKYLKEEYDISDVSFDTWLLPLEVYANKKYCRETQNQEFDI